MTQVAFSYGKFCIPTKGHEAVMARLEEFDARMRFVTHTGPADKVIHLERAFGGLFIVSPKSIFDILADIHLKGYSDVIFVHGMDRRELYKSLLKYNGKAYYNFDCLCSAPVPRKENDISSTELRQFAKERDKESFKQGVATKIAENKEWLEELWEYTIRNYDVEPVESN